MQRNTKTNRIQELRRSNAAQPHRNKKKYTRKTKHRKGARFADSAKSSL